MNCHLFEWHFVCSQHLILASLLCSFVFSLSSAFLFSLLFFPFPHFFSFVAHADDAATIGCIVVVVVGKEDIKAVV